MAREEPQDLLCHKPNVLFVETSAWSRFKKPAYENHFFARPKDVFWDLVKEYNICCKNNLEKDDPLSPLDDEQLAKLHRISFATYCLDEHGGDDDITDEEMEIGKEKIKQIINLYQPRVVCFVGRKTFEHFHNRRRLANYGMQHEKLLTLNKGIETEVFVFVLPGTLVSVKYKKKDMIQYWEELATVTNVLHKAYSG